MPAVRSAVKHGHATDRQLLSFIQFVYDIYPHEHFGRGVEDLPIARRCRRRPWTMTIIDHDIRSSSTISEVRSTPIATIYLSL